MACDQGGISYKSQKCLRQSPENWVVVKGTHDFLLKGLIFCHECGYPMAVLNRKNAAGEDRLFFGCRAYLHPDKLCPIAKEAVENASKAASCEAERQALQSKITALTTNLDQMYMDRLSGLLSEDRLKSLQSSR